MKAVRRGATAAALVAVTLALGACDDDAEADLAVTPSKATASTATAATTPGPGGAPLLVRTRITGFDGTVLPGSVLGESPFCLGGTLHHAHGSPELGFPAVNEYHCDDGDLRIGFGPGPEQQENLVQTSEWEVLDGSGRYATASGGGRMAVQFRPGEPVRGVETFLGLVAVQ